ncbi:Gamma-glutamyl-gamma-aminobutyrate hydrolase PuuD [Paraburkholderia caffeinitolerans]|uniref:gamma-glutamyl-gamma-aminobutyrate hydrolase n=1 Tax=Paraburkholderia caffeinitolerans TaxID=1723730 RepID=A0A6J5GDL8_9BURK|nr:MULTISPECIES: gamma-glutamyl-gamma-aminobutyrate hydrolase family protein [Paraburkholderia]CAB3798769.1 Gamma-glutamyl-gamma-aminobutyrate hydrolase PuuD [Paraburkholderia caffeinitolerans]
MQSNIIIGITADRARIGLHWSHAAGEKYIDPIVDGAQALAVILPALGERQSTEAILASVDGLLFTGSYSNVEPHHYGGAASAPGTLHDPQRDATTLPLMQAAVERGVPVLAICRGFQEMNVAFGGTLHQAVHAVPGLLDHRESKADPIETQYGPAHRVRIETGGVLHACSGMTEALVNSLHGQGIARLGGELSVEAVASDGLIEAFSVKSASAFALGVQWHPEWQHADNALSTAIFRAFGAACRERRRAKDTALMRGACDAGAQLASA